MGIRIGSILTPNVSRKIFCVLDNLEDLLKQQKHILEDSYSRGEAPELDDVFETLVRLTHLGPQNRLNPKMSAKIADELSRMNIKIEKRSPQRQKIHEGISRVIQSIIKGLKKRTIRGKVSTAIEIVLNRMDQISGIIPLIELRRSAALREIIRQEKRLWQLAYTLKTRRNSVTARNIQPALRRDLGSVQAPDVQSYRLNVQNAKRTVHLAIIALRKNKPKLAQKYLDHAINILGYSPQDLSPHIARI